MKKLAPYIFLIIVCLAYTFPFFRSGYFPTHDGEWAIVRLAEMNRELRDGQFPPRWSDYLNHGYGYPLFSFTYPFPYYTGAVIHQLGFGLTDSIKILFAGSVFLSAFFMFLLGRELMGVYGGFISAILYAVAPFRLVDLYVRGSIGESLSFVLFPLILFSLHKLLKTSGILWMLLSAITIALLIITHNAMAFLFIPFTVFFFFTTAYIRKIPMTATGKFFFQIFILAFGLSAYFLIPALLEKQYIALSQKPLADIRDHFIPFLDFFIPSWSFGTLPSFQLGIFHIVAAGLGLGAIFFARKNTREKRGMFLFLSISICSLLFLTQYISVPIWQVTPLSIIDFPWRLLVPLSFFVSLAAAYATKTQTLKYVIALFAVIAVIFNVQFAKPAGHFEKPDAYYETNDATTTSNDELMPIWVRQKPANRSEEKVVITEGEASVSDVWYNSHRIQFTVDASTESEVSINTIYFPGWQIMLDGFPIAVSHDNSFGIMQFRVQEGVHEMSGEFVETPIREISNIISLISYGFVLIYFVYYMARAGSETLWALAAPAPEASV